MIHRDGREIARKNEQHMLKMLHKFGFLRTRDLAALVWAPSRSVPQKGGFMVEAVVVSASALRMAQRTLRRLRENRLVFDHLGPDGSLLYGLSEGGARVLQGLDIPAKSSKNWLRCFSMAQYHHRRLANEIAISAMLQGYRTATEREIAGGLWLGGMGGVLGKKPDVLARSGKSVWWIEVERSRKNKTDYAKLINWLQQMWSRHPGPADRVELPGEHKLEKVAFIAGRAFGAKLAVDLKKCGWTDAQISLRILHIPLLYVTDTKFLTLR